MRRALSVLLLGLTLALPALADDPVAPLADPTQPPSAIVGLDGTVSMELANSGLTSVMVPKKGKPMAVIGGQLVPLGGMVGEARLVRLSETEAVLEGPEGIERLYLTPDVEKKMNVTRAASRRKRE
jgi:MSHA biogenesis protein MshK